jgi:hypothetical protein
MIARTWASAASHPHRNRKWLREFDDCTPLEKGGFPVKHSDKIVHPQPHLSTIDGRMPNQWRDVPFGQF